MTRSPILKALLLLLISFIVALPSPTRSRAEETDPRVVQNGTEYVMLFTDGFDGGNTGRWNLPEGWTAVQESGDWHLRAAPRGDASLFSPVIHSAYRFRVDLRLTGQGWAALHYRQSFGQYSLEVMEDSLSLNKFDGEQWIEPVASGSAALPLNSWHTVEISGTAGRLQVLVDDVITLDYTDPDPLYAGSVGLSVYDDAASHVDFDDVQLLAPAGEAAPWTQTGGPSGGIIESIEIDPDDPQTLYAAGAGGSVFKSSNGGAGWSALQPIVRPSEAIYDLLIEPDNPQTIYALAGRLYRSSDGGTTWQVTHPDRWFSCVAMDPAAPSTLIGGTWEGRVYRSDDRGTSWDEITGDLSRDPVKDLGIAGTGDYWAGTGNDSDGRLYHTTDGGTSWIAIDIGQSPETDIHTLFVDPEDPDRVYVGLIDVHNEVFDPVTDTYLVKTENGGSSWTPLHLPFTDAMINVMGRTPTDGTLYVGTGGTVFKSEDDGQSWTWIGPPGRNGDMRDIAVNPEDGAVLYLPRRAHGIVKSTDGGAGWSPINEGLRNVSISLLASPGAAASRTLYATAVSGEGVFKTVDYGRDWSAVTDGGITHPWGDELVVSPHDPQAVIYIADVGQVFQSLDGGTTWEKSIDPYGPGFRFGSIYALATAPSDPDRLYALKNGFGIFKSADGGHSWNFLHQSEIDYTYSLAVHPTDPDVVYSGYSPKPFQRWAMVRQSSDGGLTWRTSLSVPHSSGVTSVAVDPHAPDRVYAGSAGAGGRVWATHDGGDHWSTPNPAFNFTNLHVLTVDPSDPDVAYAGVWGGGTFRTADGGATWTRLPRDPTPSAAAILVHPTDPDRIYIADRNAPRIYRTLDGGTTWETFFDAGTGYYRVLSAALAPGDPDTLYASIFTYGGPMAGDVFRIRSGTGTRITGSLSRLPVALTADPSDGNIVYAVLHGYGVYRTDDSGAGWVELSAAGSGLPQTPHVGFNTLVVDPNDPDTLYLAGGCDVDVDFTHTGADPAEMHTVYRSTDRGATWTNLNDGNLGASSDSVKGLVVSPTDPDLLYLGTLRGVYRSSDGGASWTGISAGLGYTHTAGIGIAPDGSRLYVPTLGGGVYTAEVNTSSHQITWAPTSTLTATIHHVQVAVDPVISQTLYASAYPGGTFKSLDGGRTWAECNFGMASFEIDDPSRQGYYAFAIAPSDPDVLYLGLYGVGIYKSTDGAGTWQPANGTPPILRGKPITALLIDPADAEVVTVATEEGVYRSSDGGATWSDLSAGLDCTDVRVLALDGDGTLYAGTRGYELYAHDGSTWQQMNAFGNFGTRWPIWDDRPLYQYTSLLFHPTDPDQVYVGTFPAGIYKSGDGGASWREQNVGWTNDGVFSLVFHPEDSETVYAGTYNGVNRSTDGGDHWEMWDEGWPDEQWVFSIDFDPRDPQVIYACSKNGENEGLGREGFHGTVMKSVDGGAGWFPITTGLNLDQEFYKIIVDPRDPDTLYLATQREGVFISRNGGELWLPWNEGLSNLHAGTNGNNVTHTMLLSSDGLYLFFGSAGSGVFRRSTITLSNFVYLPVVLREGT
jgi:photosystem II stability/assembly factor-like uncharacterized protein